MVNKTSARIFLKNGYTALAPYQVSVGLLGGTVKNLQVCNLGQTVVYFRGMNISSGEAQSPYQILYPEHSGWIAFSGSPTENIALELFKPTEYRFINMHSSRSPEDMLGVVEIYDLDS